MATSKEYLNFILECLSETDNITYRQMMGEYIIYYRGKIAAYICDDRLLVKPVEAAIKMLKNARYEPPYEGAKEMLLVDNIEDKMFLKKLFEAMYDSLPEPKKKGEIKVKNENTKADIESLVNLLDDKNNTVACGAMNSLSEMAENSDAVYKYMDKFIKMLSSSNSYVRNRGLKLISVNAKWDTDFKIDEIIDEYLKHITDIKPITARQCISFLPEIAKHKKDLKDDILSALSCADVTKYPDSMQGLVLKDIEKAIREIANCE